MGHVVFIDTTVLLNLLNVPHNNDEHAGDTSQLKRLVGTDATLVLPFTTIIETGNAIVRNAGRQVHACGCRLVAVLRATMADEAPWVASGVGLTHALLPLIVDGRGGVPALLDLMMVSGVGTGDAGILAEICEYRQRIPSATPVAIWTHDEGLKAYSPTAMP